MVSSVISHHVFNKQYLGCCICSSAQNNKHNKAYCVQIESIKQKQVGRCLETQEKHPQFLRWFSDSFSRTNKKSWPKKSESHDSLICQPFVLGILEMIFTLFQGGETLGFQGFKVTSQGLIFALSLAWFCACKYIHVSGGEISIVSWFL